MRQGEGAGGGNFIIMLSMLQLQAYLASSHGRHIYAASLQRTTCNVQRATRNLVVLASNALTAFSPFNRPTD